MRHIRVVDGIEIEIFPEGGIKAKGRSGDYDLSLDGEGSCTCLGRQNGHECRHLKALRKIETLVRSIQKQ